MYQINDDLSIYATRGDIVIFKVSAEDNGEDYLFPAGAVLRMTIFEKKACDRVVLQKDFPILEDTIAVEILLEEHETRIGNLISKPVDYWYEIELNPLTAPQTIIGYDEDGPKMFRLFPEGDKLEEPKPDITPEDIPIVDPKLDLLSSRPVENRVIAASLIRIEENVKNAVNTAEKNAEALKTHVESKGNPHGLTAEDVGARPNTWTPTAEDVGARPNTWTPTAEDVGARSKTWTPTAEDVGARSKTWTPTAEDVGARPNTWKPKAADLLEAYPVGAIYLSVNSTSPANIFGGTWIQLKDRFLLGAGSTYKNGSTGGASTHTLSIDEIPNHDHAIAQSSPTYTTPTEFEGNNLVRTTNNQYLSGFSAKVGGGEAHNNMPPYLVVYMWKRTA